MSLVTISTAQGLSKLEHSQKLQEPSPKPVDSKVDATATASFNQAVEDYFTGGYPVNALPGCRYVPLTEQGIVKLTVANLIRYMTDGMLHTPNKKPAMDMLKVIVGYFNKYKTAAPAISKKFNELMERFIKENSKQVAAGTGSEFDKLKGVLKLLSEESNLLLEGVKRVATFHFNEADYEIRNKWGEKISLYGVADCFNYVLYHYHEKKLFNYVFENRDRFVDDFIKFPAIDPSFGYEEVQVPKKGDLIMYYGTPNGKAQAMHIGIYLEPGKVISKFFGDDVYQHSETSIPPHFGPSYKYYRKAIKFDVLKDFIEILKKMKDQDPAPLTTLGAIDKSEKTFFDMLSEAEKTMVPHSLFGRGCLPHIFTKAQQFFKQLKESLVKHDEMTKLEAISSIQKFMETVSDEIPLNFDLLFKERINLGSKVIKLQGLDFH